MTYHPASGTKHLHPLRPGMALAGAIALSSGAHAADIEIDADGRLSVEARDSNPVEVMQEIAAQAPFELVVSKGVEAVPGSWSFDSVPVEVGISRVLGHVDYILIRRAGGDAGTGIDRVWILSKSTPVTSVSSGEDSAETDPAATQQSLQEAFREISEIATSSEPDRTASLLTYVDHTDRRVRLSLAGALGRVGDQEAVLALGQMMFGDAETSVRRAAATALADNRSAAAIEMLRGGLEVEDPQVKQHVRRILANIDAR